MNDLLAIAKRLDRIEAKLSVIMQERNVAKETWVKVKMITDLTGWNNQQLYAARRNQVIRWRRDKTGFWYLLESIPDDFKKSKNHEPNQTYRNVSQVD